MIEKQWEKSVFSEPNGGSCVEVDLSGAEQDDIAVRDTKLGEESPVLHFTRDEWEAHLLAVKAGQHDIAGDKSKVALLASAIGALAEHEMLELSTAIKVRTMELLLDA